MTASISPIPASAIGEAWPVLAQILAPAVAFDRNVSLDELRDKLVTGQCEAASVVGEGIEGVIVTEICWFDGVKVCWLSYVAGTIGAAPRRWLSMARDVAAQVELLARSIDCQEVRIGGRDWSRILPDYERFDDEPNRMRKVLNG